MIGAAGSRRSRSRRGAVTLEAILGVLVLVILFVAVLEFGIVGIVRHAVFHAATVAAREAGKGASINELAAVVENILSPHRITLGLSAAVILEDPDASTVETKVQRVGSMICDPTKLPNLAPGDVRVTVCVRLDKKPFVNGLSAFGVDFSNRYLQASTVVRKEQ